MRCPPPANVRSASRLTSSPICEMKQTQRWSGNKMLNKIAQGNINIFSHFNIRSYVHSSIFVYRVCVYSICISFSLIFTSRLGSEVDMALASKAGGSGFVPRRTVLFILHIFMAFLGINYLNIMKFVLSRSELVENDTSLAYIGQFWF